MKKKLKITLVIIMVIMAVIFGVVAILNKRNTYDIYSDIPKNYIAIFHGGTGERTYETYIYKIDNGQANYGFKYINVTSTTESYGSSNYKHEITDRGEFDWTDGAFGVARKNGAYSYVTLPNDNKTYNIEEFQRMFIMN